jgi:O-6-methylguanine DNA methyltransferase
MTPFERRVLTVVSRIPPGRVTTYGAVAKLAGRPGAARAVGNILREAGRPGLPYHRVIAAGGALGGYSNLQLKRSLLAAGPDSPTSSGPPSLATRATARSSGPPRWAVDPQKANKYEPFRHLARLF